MIKSERSKKSAKTRRHFVRRLPLIGEGADRELVGVHIYMAVETSRSIASDCSMSMRAGDSELGDDELEVINDGTRLVDGSV